MAGMKKRIYPGSSQGFTLGELLGGVIAAAIFVSGTAAIVVQLLVADRRESARTETQAEIQAAINFIANDLRQAVYIYNDEFQPPNNLQGSPDGIPDLQQILLNPDGPLIPVLGSGQVVDRPILAFWRLSNLDQDCRPSVPFTPQPSPSPNDTTVAAQNSFRSTGVAFELVVYYLKRNKPIPTNAESGDIWFNQGPARIIRRFYRPHRFSNCKNGNSINRELNPGYVPPEPPFFTRWPYNASTPPKVVNLSGQSRTFREISDDGSWVDAEVLVAHIHSTPLSDPSSQAPSCPPGYSLSSSDARFGFYACVGNKDTRNNPSSSQDIYVHITGNAYERAGFPRELWNKPDDLCPPTGDPGYCPAVSRHVFIPAHFRREDR